MEIKFNDGNVNYKALFVREEVVSRSGSKKPRLELWLADEESFDNAIGEIAVIDSLAIEIINDNGDAVVSYSSYKLSRAYKNYVNDTDNGFECRFILLLEKQDV